MHVARQGGTSSASRQAPGHCTQVPMTRLRSEAAPSQACTASLVPLQAHRLQR
jgi:hypothetical protein